MKILNNFRIKNKIIIIIIVIGALSTISGSLINYFYELHNTKDRLIENTILQAKLISENCWLPLEFNYPDNATKALQQLHTIPNAQNAALYTLHDSLFASFHKIGNKTLNIPKELERVDFCIIGDSLFIKQAVEFKDKFYGTLYLQSNINWSAIATSRLLITLAIIAFMLILIAVLALILQGSISQPIIELSHEMGVVALKKDYTVQLKNSAHDEIGELYSEFNNMLAEINKREMALKNAFDSLHERNRFIESLISLSPDILYIYDIIEYKNIFSNEGIQRILGYSINEVQEMGDQLMPILMHPDDFIVYKEKIFPSYATAKDGESIVHQYRMKDISGEWHWIESTEVIYNRLEDGTAQQIFGMGHDITERKLAEQVIRDSEEKFRNLFENMNDGFALHKIILDENEKPIDYEFLEVNTVFSNRIGMKSEDFINRRALELFPKTEQSWIDVFGRVAITGQPELFTSYSAELNKYYETRLYCPRPGYFAGLFSDITERKKIEEALIESEAIHRNLVERMPDGVYKSTPDGKFVDVNPAMAKMLGYDNKEELLNIDIKSQLYFSPNDRESLILQEKSEEIGIYRLRKKDGECIWVEDHGWYNLDEKGNVLFHEGILRDITERKKAEELIRENERRIRAIFDLSFGFIGLLTPDGTVIEANNTALDFSGTTREKVLGKPFWETIWWSHSLDMQELIRSAIHSASYGEMMRFEATHPAIDGTLHIIDVSLKPVKNENGTITLLIAEGRDITERKLAEKVLNENQRFLKNLISNLSGMVYRCMNKADWTMEFVSEGSLALTGYKPEQLIHGLEIEYGNLIHQDDQKMVWDVIQAGIQAKQPYIMEYRIINAGGSEKWVWEQGSCVFSELGDLIGLEGFITDITERKHAEKELEKYREHLEDLVEERTQELKYSFSLINAAMNSTADGILIVNREGHIALWNQKFVNLWNVPENLLDTTVKDPVLNYVTQQMTNPDQFLSKVMELYDHPEVISDDLLYLADGRIFERYSQPQQIGDDIVGRVWSFRNITEQKQAEENLRQAKELAESANKAKSLFLANMTHEIRTPMNAVLGFAQLLERDPALSSLSRNKVSTIIKSGEHLLGIINNILEVSRIEAGKVEIRNEAVDLHSLLNDLSVMFRMQAENKGLSFTLDLSANLPLYIIADMGKLRQILINLLGNAVKFTQKGSISISAFSSGIDRVTIIVKDTGIGISPEEQKKLFQPFERTRSGEQVAGGTGLGLVISREYAHFMGGEISIESTKNLGSSFLFEFHAPMTIMLPVSKNMTHRVISLSPNQGDIHVLIVDDQKTNRDLLRCLLEPLGFIVEEALSGEDCITKVCNNLPNIILMDMVMPGMSGLETTKAIRTACNSDSLVIIGISASAFETEKQNFIDAGLNAFIAKPFREQELFDLLIQHAGTIFETEQITPISNLQISIEKPTMEKAPTEWREAFNQALAKGSITQIRQLAEIAKEFDSVLSDYVLDRVNMYDISGLKKLC